MKITREFIDRMTHRIAISLIAHKHPLDEGEEGVTEIFLSRYQTQQFGIFPGDVEQQLRDVRGFVSIDDYYNIPERLTVKNPRSLWKMKDGLPKLEEHEIGVIGSLRIIIDKESESICALWEQCSCGEPSQIKIFKLPKE